MSVHRFQTGTNPEYIETVLHGMAEAGRHVIAVEVMEGPETRRLLSGDKIGPWMVGDAHDVYAELRAADITWTREHYEIDHTDIEIEKES